MAKGLCSSDWKLGQNLLEWAHETKRQGIEFSSRHPGRRDPDPISPSAGDRGDQCNRFCGLAARWNANVQTMVLPRVALTAEEVAAAVGQQAMVFQELASALVEIRLPVVLGFPSGQALRRFFAARREQPSAE